MKIVEQTITVKVSKTIQENSYEPLTVQLEESRTYDKIKNVIKTRQDLYKELKKQLNDIITDI